MISRMEKERIKLLLRETIMLLCKNGLPYTKEFNLEALIGITLDKKDVVLISLNELIRGQNSVTADPNYTPGMPPPRSTPKKRGGKTGRPRGRPPKRLRTLTQPDYDDDIPDEAPSDIPEPDPDTIEMKTEALLESLDADISAAPVPDMDSTTDDGSSSESDVEELTPDQQSLLDKMKEAVTQQMKKHASSNLVRDSSGLQPMDLGESQKIWQKAFDTARFTTRTPSTEPKKKSMALQSPGDAEASEDGIMQEGIDPLVPMPPPMCHICGKTMSTEKNLTKHVRRHLGMFSVYCDECGKGFFDRTDLNSHSAKHKDTKLYQCDVCGRSYSHKRGLYKHIRKDHEGGDDKEIEAMIAKASARQSAPLPPVSIVVPEAPEESGLSTSQPIYPEQVSTPQQPIMAQTPPMSHTPALSHVSDTSQPADLSHPSPVHQPQYATDLSQASSLQHALAMAQAQAQSMMSPPPMMHHPAGVAHSMHSLSAGLPPHFQHHSNQQHLPGLPQPPYHRY